MLNKAIKPLKSVSSLLPVAKLNFKTNPKSNTKSKTVKVKTYEEDPIADIEQQPIADIEEDLIKIAKQEEIIESNSSLFNTNITTARYGIQHALSLPNPPIFMRILVDSNNEREPMRRCCYTIDEVEQDLYTHILSLQKSITGTEIVLPYDRYIVQCFISINTETTTDPNYVHGPGYETVEITFNRLIDEAGNINEQTYKDTIDLLRSYNAIFLGLDNDTKIKILSYLEIYNNYKNPESFIRKAQGYHALKQTLQPLSIDPVLENYLAQLIKGYEETLQNKGISEYIDWLNHIIQPEGETLSNPELTYIYLQSTFDQIERLFSIDMYEIILHELLPDIPEHITIGDTITVGDKNVSIPAASNFNDVLQKINSVDDPLLKMQLKFVYNFYFLLKSLCFILHDKPVNSFVDILLEYIVLPMFNYSANTFTDIHSIIIGFVTIWREGFTKGGSSVASQTRSHQTAANLTTSFTQVMKHYNIIVPEKILIYSMPYSVFRYDIAEKKRVNELLKYFKYALSDAVGNEFIQNLHSDIELLFPFGPAIQDAAPPSRTNGPLIVIKEDILVSQTGAMNTAAMSTQGIELEKQVVDIHTVSYSSSIVTEPVRFGDIVIYPLQNGTVQPFVLYYLDPMVHFPSENIASIISEFNTGSGSGILIDFMNNLNTSWSTDIFKNYMIINDVGVYGLDGLPKIKLLFGVSYGRISQNDTIPLIKDLLDMSKSARGSGPPKNIVTLKWLGQNTNTYIEKKSKVLLASFTKELGDQAKRNVVELLNSNGASGKGFLATVDTFLPHAFINGLCIVRAGNIEIYEQEGFRTIDRDTIVSILKIIKQYEDYQAISRVVNNFLEQIKQSIKTTIDYLVPNIKAHETSEPNIDIFKHLLLYYGIYTELHINPLLISIDAFQSIVYNFITTWQTPGFSDANSFMKRIFSLGKIREIFAIYEKDIDTFQSFFITYESGGKTFTEKHLGRIIEKYYTYHYVDPLFDFDTEINKVIDEAPLFYLLKYWNDMKSIRIPNKGRNSIPNKPLPIYSIEVYYNTVSHKIHDFIKKYVDETFYSEIGMVLNRILPDFTTRINLFTNENESAYDDSQSSQIETLVDYAENDDAQNIVNEPSTEVLIEIPEHDIIDFGTKLRDPQVLSVIDTTLSMPGGKIFGNKNLYSRRKITKKNTKRLRKTRKITKRPKYIKKNVTKICK